MNSVSYITQKFIFSFIYYALWCMLGLPFIYRMSDRRTEGHIFTHPTYYSPKANARHFQRTNNQ